MMMDIYNMIPMGGTCYFADKNALKGTLLENINTTGAAKIVLPTWRTVCELDDAAWYCVPVI